MLANKTYLKISLRKISNFEENNSNLFCDETFLLLLKIIKNPDID